MGSMTGDGVVNGATGVRRGAAVKGDAVTLFGISTSYLTIFPPILPERGKDSNPARCKRDAGFYLCSSSPLARLGAW